MTFKHIKKAMEQVEMKNDLRRLEREVSQLNNWIEAEHENQMRKERLVRRYVSFFVEMTGVLAVFTLGLIIGSI